MNRIESFAMVTSFLQIISIVEDVLTLAQLFVNLSIFILTLFPHRKYFAQTFFITSVGIYWKKKQRETRKLTATKVSLKISVVQTDMRIKRGGKTIDG